MNVNNVLGALVSNHTSDVIRAVNEIKERIDFVHTPEFGSIISHMFPILRELMLSKYPPQFEDNDENKIRQTILEIFSRFPTTEALRPIVIDLISISLRVLQDDNEDNAVAAVKIMFDLHKTFRPSLENHVQPLVDAVLVLYKNVPNSVRKMVMDNYNSAPAISSANIPSHSQTLSGLSSSSYSGPVGGAPGPVAISMPTQSTVGSVLSGTPISQPLQLQPIHGLGSTELGSQLGQSGGISNAGQSSNGGNGPDDNSGGLLPTGLVGHVSTTGQLQSLQQQMPTYNSSFPPYLPGSNVPMDTYSNFYAYSNSSVSNYPQGSQPPNSGTVSSGGVSTSLVGPGQSSQSSAGAMTGPLVGAVKTYSSQQTHPQTAFPGMLSSQCPAHSVQHASQQVGNIANVPGQIQQSSAAQSTTSQNGSLAITGSHPSHSQQQILLQHHQQQVAHMQQMQFLGPAGSRLLTNSLVPASHSLKVLAECPQILMFVLQVYYKLLQKSLPALMEVVMSFLDLSPPPPPSNNGGNGKLKYKDLLQAQIKSLTLVSFVFRMAAELMKPYESAIVSCIRVLLARCPDDSISMRKDLVVSIKSLMTSDLKQHFFPHFSEVIDLRFLLGPAKPAILRPFAILAIIEFVMQVKDIMNVAQVTQVVQVFCVHLSDPTLNVAMQASSIRLLFLLVEVILQFPPDHFDLSQYLLFLILRSAVNKIECLYDFCIRFAENSSDSGMVISPVSDIAPLDSEKSLLSLLPPLLRTSVDGNEASTSLPTMASGGKLQSSPALVSLKDVKQLARTLFWGLKTTPLIVTLQTRKSSRSRSADPGASRFMDEINAIVFSRTDGKYFLSQAMIWGLHLCECFINASSQSVASSIGDGASDELSGSTSQTTSSSQSLADNPETADIVDNISHIFLAFEQIHLREVFDAILPVLYEKIKIHQIFLLTIQLLVNNPVISSAILDILMCFLLSKLHELGQSAHNPDANMLFKIFKIVFQSLGKITENEKILRPRLLMLVISCLRQAREASNPKIYLHLLKLVFRCISGGKFEQSYKVFGPAVPILLHGFSSLLQCTANQNLQAILLELILTMPVKFAILVAHMPTLLRHIARALRFKGDVAKFGMRMLELWIDHLNPEVVANILHHDSVLANELISGVCDHLKVSPHPFGTSPTAITLLGKLGCHNETFLRGMKLGPLPSCQTLFSEIDHQFSPFIEQSFAVSFGSVFYSPKDGDEEEKTEKVEAMNYDVTGVVSASCELLHQLKSAVFPIYLQDSSSDSSSDFQSSTVLPSIPIGLTDERLCFLNSQQASQAYRNSKELRNGMKKYEDVVQTELTVTPADGGTTVGLDTKVLSQELHYLYTTSVESQKLVALRTVLRALSCLLDLDQTNSSRHQIPFVQEQVSVADDEYYLTVLQADNKSPSRKHVLYTLLQSVLVATIDKTLKNESSRYLIGFCRYSMLAFMDSLTVCYSSNPSIVQDTDGASASVGSALFLQLDINTMIEVVMTLLIDFRPKVVAAGVWILEEYLSVLSSFGESLRMTTTPRGSKTPSSTVPGTVFSFGKKLFYCRLIALAIEKCQAGNPYFILGGIRAIGLLFQSAYVCNEDFPVLRSNAPQLVQAILNSFHVSDVGHSPSGFVGSISSILLTIIRKLFENQHEQIKSDGTEIASSPIVSAKDSKAKLKSVAVSPTLPVSPKAGGMVSDKLSSFPKSEISIVEFFIFNLASESPTKRQASEVCLQFIAEILEIDLVVIVNHFVTELRSTVYGNIPGDGTLPDDLIAPHFPNGIIFSLGFVMATKSSFFLWNDRLLSVLIYALSCTEFNSISMDAIERSLDFSSSLVEGQLHDSPASNDRNKLFNENFQQKLVVGTFPYDKMSPHIESRILFLRLFRGFIGQLVAAESEISLTSSDLYVNIITRSVSLLFRTLLLPSHKCLESEALSTLETVLRLYSALKANSCSEESLISHLDQIKSKFVQAIETNELEFLQNLSTPRSLFAPYLRAIALILECCPSEHNRQACVFLCDHLKRVNEPDYLLHAGVCFAGQEHFIAGILLNTMQYMPNQTSYSKTCDSETQKTKDIIAYFADCVRFCWQLEAARFRFRHASADTPKYSDVVLAFACRFPDECIPYLLDPSQFVREEISSLVLAFVRSSHPRALEFRGHMCSPGSMALVIATIAPAVESNFGKDTTSSETINGNREEASRDTSAAAFNDIHGVAKRSITVDSNYFIQLEDKVKNLTVTTHGLLLVEALSQANSGKDCWLNNFTELVSFIRKLWVASVNVLYVQSSSLFGFSRPMFGAIAMVRMIKCCAKFLMTVPIDHPNFHDIIYELLSVLTIKQNVEDFSNVASYLKRVVKKLPVKEKRSLVVNFILHIFNPNILILTKIVAIQSIVLPIILSVQADPSLDALLDPNVVKLIVQEIVIGATLESSRSFQQDTNAPVVVSLAELATGTHRFGDWHSSSDRNPVESGIRQDSRPGDIVGQVLPIPVGKTDSSRIFAPVMIDATMSSLIEQLRVELMKICNWMLDNCSTKLKSYKRELVKYAWSSVRAEDSLLQNWANVILCRFFSVFESPSKIIVQTYVGLLKGFQPENKDIIRNAIDILVPTLPSRLPQEELVRIVKWTKKMLMEETHSQQNLIHILQIIVRHPEIFYPFRMHLVPQMITCMSRIGLPSNAAVENRVVALNVADVLIGWEWCRLQRISRSEQLSSINSIEPIVARDENGTQIGLRKKRDFAALSLSIDTPDTADNSMVISNDSLAVSTDDMPPLKQKRQDVRISTSNPMNLEVPSLGKVPNLAIRPSLGPLLAIDERDSEKTLNLTQIQLLVNFIIRLGAISAADTKDPALGKLYSRCIDLLKRMVVVYPLSGAKLTYFEKLLAGVVENAGAQAAKRETSAPASSTGVTASASAASNTSQTTGARTSKDPTTSSQLVASGMPPFAPTFATQMNDAVGKPVSLSEPSLILFLEILSTSLDCIDGPSNQVIQSTPAVLALLLWAMDSKSFKLHSIMRKFLGKIFRLYPPSNPPTAFAEHGFYGRLKDMIDRRLTLESSDNQVATNPHHGQLQSVVDRQPLFLTLLCIEVIGKTNPEWCSNHAQAILKISHSLLSDHVGRASKSSIKSTDANYFPGHSTEVGQEFSVSSCHPLASTLLFAEYIGSDGVPSFTHSAAPQVTVSASNPVSMAFSRLTTISHNCSTCAIGLTILCQSLHLGFVRYLKSTIMAMLIAVIEHSDNPHFLNIVAKICNAWIAQPRSPLTAPEQWHLFCKISNGCDRFAEYSAHPFMVRFTALSERMGNWYVKCPREFERIFEGCMVSDPCDPRGVLGMLSSYQSLHQQCLRRIAKCTGSNPFDVINYFVSKEYPQFGNRFLPLFLPALIMQSCKESACNFVSPQSQSALVYTAGPYSSDHELKHLPTSDLQGTMSIFARNEQDRILLRSFVDENLKYCNSASELFDDMSSVLMFHGRCCEEFWNELIAKLWRSVLKHDQKIELTANIQRFLVQNRFRKYLTWPADAPGQPSSQNVCQYFLSAMLALEPRPKFTVEFLQAMSINYNCSTVVIPYLESICLRNHDVLLARRAFLISLGAYHRLGETHQSLALSRLMFAQNSLTDVALSLEMFDRVAEAHQLYSTAFDFKHRQHLSSKLSSGTGDAIGDTSEYDVNSANHIICDPLELELWEQRWVRTARDLTQWNLLQDVTKGQNESRLALDCAVNRNDWEAVKKIRAHPDVVASVEWGDVSVKIVDIMLCIIDNNSEKYKYFDNHAMQLALHEWQSYPPICSGSNIHKAALHTFHRLVELRESNEIMAEVGKATREKTFPDLKRVLKNWRLRLCDQLPRSHSIDSLLEWRVTMFGVIKNIFQNVSVKDPSQINSLTDTSWTLLKSARIFRKGQRLEAALTVLQRMRSFSAMEVSEVFTKIREQSLLANSNVPEHLMAALHLVSTTNLEYFSSPQKAELFRLKGIFLDKLSSPIEANEAYAHGVQISPKHDATWLSWANFNFELFIGAARQIANSEVDVSTVANDLNDLALKTVVCILKAAGLESAPAKLLLRRALWLAKYFEDSSRSIANVFSKFAGAIRQTAWLPVLRQLTSLAVNWVPPITSVPTESALNATSSTEGAVAVMANPYATLINSLGLAQPNAVIFELTSRLKSTGNREVENHNIRQIVSDLKVSGGPTLRSGIDLIQSFQDVMIAYYAFPAIDDVDTTLKSLWKSIIDDGDINLVDNCPTSLKQVLKEAVRLLSRDETTTSDKKITKSSSKVPAVTSLNDPVDKVISLCAKEAQSIISARGSTYLQVLNFLKRWLVAFYNLRCNRLRYLRTSPWVNFFCCSGDFHLSIPGEWQNHCYHDPTNPRRVPTVMSIRPAPLCHDHGVLASSNQLSAFARISFVDEEGHVRDFEWRRHPTAYLLRREVDCIHNFDWILENSSMARSRDLYIGQPLVAPLDDCTILQSVIPGTLSLVGLSAAASGDSVSISHHLDLILRARVELNEETQIRMVADSESMFVDDALSSNSSPRERVFLRFAKSAPSTLIRNAFRASCSSIDSYFAATRTFANQLGLSAALNLFARATESLPESFKFNSNGMLVPVDLASAVTIPWLDCATPADAAELALRNRQRWLEIHPVVRLTRNITASLSNALILGGVVESMGCAVDAFVFQKPITETIFIDLHSELFAIDEASSDQDQDALAKHQLMQALATLKLSDEIFAELARISPTQVKFTANDDAIGSEGERIPVDAELTKLITRANDSTILANQTLRSMAWL